jgi:hypothetical protein
LHLEGRKEGKKMKKAMMAMMLMAGGLFAAPHVAVGIGFGVPAPVVVRPVCPGPGYVWVNGYWQPPVVRVAPVVRYGVRPGFRGYEHFRR